MKPSLAFCFVLLALPRIGTAQSDFNYLETDVAALDADVGALELSADSYSLNFSKDYRDRFLLELGYTRRLFDSFESFSMEQELYAIRLGYHYSVFRHVDVYGTVGYEFADSLLADGSTSTSGLAATAGLKARPMDRLELSGGLEYTDYANPILLTGPKTLLVGEARWYFTDRLSVGFGGWLGEHEHSWLASLRFSFEPPWLSRGDR